MIKRILPVTLALILALSFIPVSAPAQAAAFSATLMGQLDTGVSTSIDEWGFGDIPEATVAFDMYKPATISMTFSEPIKFTGNWTGISTDVPVVNNDIAKELGGKILSFIVDGNELGDKVVPVIDRDDGGFLTIDIARQWGGDYDDYDLAGMDPFSSLEITFVVGHTATLMGQLDTSVSDAVGEWDFGGIPEASVYFAVGQEATISMEFAKPIKFTGNWTGIATSIPVVSDEDAESTGAHITSFKVDGTELGSKLVPLINRDDSGFLTIDIARQWGGDYDDYDLAGMDPFSKLELSFIVPNMGAGDGDVASTPGDFATAGHAWIGGTFMTDDGDFDWIPYEDQMVPFELGVPFVATLDFGAGKNTHGEAGWGYITVVQTDIMDSASFYDAFIEDILVDGRSISFDANNIEVGFDGGVRISLTNGWAETPVVAGAHVIGEFSKLEVVMAFVAVGDPNPFGGAEAPPEAPPTEPPPPITAPPTRPPEPPADDGLPGWVIPVIIAGVVVVGGAVVFFVMKGKKAE